MNDVFQTQTKLGIAGRLAHAFLYNKVLAVLSIIVIAVWGVLSFVIMPKQYNPEIIAPAFMISVDYPDANSAEVYGLITRPMEDKISELTNIDNISSQSFPGGRSIVTVKFNVGSNQEDAKISLNQKLQDNIDLKPSGASDPVIRSIDPDDVPIIDIGLASDAYSESSLRKMARDAADNLKQAPGVSKVEIVGGRINNLHVTPKSAELSARNISLDEISGAIASVNGIYTADVLSGDSRNATINIIGNISGADELAKVVIKENNGVPIRIGEVADVVYGAGEIDNYVTLRGEDGGKTPVVHIALSKLKGTNATTVAKDVETRLQDVRGKIIPDDVNVSILKDEGETASKEIGKLTFDLAKSILIVALLLMMFLGVRNSMVATISIPLVLLVVFGAGLLWGQTVNRITLFALILSLGLLVDDAIVVIENIARYFRLYPDEDRRAVIVKSVDEVGSALALSTLTMALAFVPMAFVTGMMGPYMGPIPFFVPVALFASLALSVTINPFLAYVLTKPNRKKDGAHNIFLRGFAKIERGYGRLLAYLLEKKRRYHILISTVGLLFILSVILLATPLVPFRMLPKADRDQFYIYLDLPEGAKVDKTQEYADQVGDIALKQEHVKVVESFVGIPAVTDFNGLFRGSNMRTSERQATMRVDLSAHEERSVSSEEIAAQLRSDSSDYVKGHPGLQMRIVEDPPGPPVLSTFLLKIKGGDTGMREAIATDMSRLSEKIDGIIDIDTSIPDYILNHTYQIDIQKAQLLGVSPQSIKSAIRAAVSGSSAGIYHVDSKGASLSDQQYIIVRLDKNDRGDIGVLSSLSVPSQNGSIVPLSEVLHASDEAFDVPIASEGRQPTTYVSGEMSGRSVVYAVIDMLKELKGYHLPGTDSRLVDWSILGATYEDMSTGEKYEIGIDGEWKLTLDAFRDLGIAMLIAIFMIYFVIATKVKSLNIPLLIMVSIPLGLIGVFPGFALLHIIKGTYFNATSMIGVIALAGLSVKNSVIFLEYLEPLRERGLSLQKALLETGRIRLLPIVLTSLTAIFGNLTIISDPVWEGLAWAIIFGLAMSTFLTLVVFPVIYYAVEAEKWSK